MVIARNEEFKSENVKKAEEGIQKLKEAAMKRGESLRGDDGNSRALYSRSSHSGSLREWRKVRRNM